MALLKSMSQQTVPVTAPVTEPVTVFSPFGNSIPNGIRISTHVRISFNTEELTPISFYSFFNGNTLPYPHQQMSFSARDGYKVMYTSTPSPTSDLDENGLLTVDNIIGPHKITDDIYVHFKDGYDIRRSLNLDIKDRRLIAYIPDASGNNTVSLIPYVTREKLEAWIRVFLTFRTLIED